MVSNATCQGFCLFVYLEFIVPLKIFHSYGNVTIAGEGLQILTYARHTWSLSSEGSLTCHNYCDTGLPYIMVISEDPWHSHLLPSVRQWIYQYLFLRLGSVATGDRTPDLTHARRTLYLYATAAVLGLWMIEYSVSCSTTSAKKMTDKWQSLFRGCHYKSFLSINPRRKLYV